MDAGSDRSDRSDCSDRSDLGEFRDGLDQWMDL